MTKEEREKKREERIAYRDEMARRFPFFTYGDSGVRLTLNAGDDTMLKITAEGDWWEDEDDKEKYTLFYLGNAVMLGEFILALTTRYNALVDKMNATAAQVKVKPAEPIEP